MIIFVILYLQIVQLKINNKFFGLTDIQIIPLYTYLEEVSFYETETLYGKNR